MVWPLPVLLLKNGDRNTEDCCGVAVGVCPPDVLLSNGSRGGNVDNGARGAPICGVAAEVCPFPVLLLGKIGRYVEGDTWFIPICVGRDGVRPYIVLLPIGDHSWCVPFCGAESGVCLTVLLVDNGGENGETTPVC